MKQRKNGALRVFFLSFTVTLCVLILAVGFCTVDFRGRSMSFGDDTPLFRITTRPDGGSDLQIKALGQDTVVDFTFFHKMWTFLLDFSCLPHN